MDGQLFLALSTAVVEPFFYDVTHFRDTSLNDLEVPVRNVRTMPVGIHQNMMTSFNSLY